MIKYRKIRGHNRIQKEIENWKNYTLQLDEEELAYRQREYCKIWVSPFADISVTGSEIPSPKGKNRKLILESLLVIYNAWEKQLKELNTPYYLAIWLFEPRIEKSQIVCAVGSMLNFYDVTFHRPKEQRQFPSQNYGKLQDKLQDFNWIYALDEDTFTQSDVDASEEDYFTQEDYNAIQKWYRKKIKQNIRTYEFNKDTIYNIRKGTVWIGTKK